MRAKLQFLLVSFLALISPFYVYADDFRSWRWESTHNSRLEDHVIESKMALSLLSCLSLCALVPGCRTVNHRTEGGNCELNEADDRWDGILSPVSDQSFGYYRRVVPTSALETDAAHANKTCHVDHVLLNNTCLEIVATGNHNYSSAVETCHRRYGRLAVLDTPELQSVLGLLGPYGSPGNYYIDIVRRSDGILVWGATQVPVDLATPPWLGGQPDNYLYGAGPEDCGDIEKSGTEYYFLDIPCNLGDRGYICQYGQYASSGRGKFKFYALTVKPLGSPSFISHGRTIPQKRTQSEKSIIVSSLFWMDCSCTAQRKPLHA